MAKKNKTPELPSFEQCRIITVPIERLIPYQRNLRKYDDTIPVLEECIRQFGFDDPIVIDNDNFIICGHARWKAARRLGLKELPCIKVTDLNPRQVNAYRLADNKTAEQSEWNKAALTRELKTWSEFDFKPFSFEPLTYKGEKGTLARDFIVPPFSVIQSRSDICLNLDVKWAPLCSSCKQDYPAHLCEILFNWFTPVGGTIISPLYKSDVAKYIAAELGYKYLDNLPSSEEETDMLFLDLFSFAEQSMSLDADTLNTIKGAAGTLSDNRFIVAIVKERNDASMGYRSTKGSELEKFLRELGFKYYNELIHIYKDTCELDDDHEAFLRTRKVPSRHLTMMVFYKGKVKKIRDIFPDKCTTKKKEVSLSA